jgi:hypothetical protein
MYVSYVFRGPLPACPFHVLSWPYLGFSRGCQKILHLAKLILAGGFLAMTALFLPCLHVVQRSLPSLAVLSVILFSESPTIPVFQNFSYPRPIQKWKPSDGHHHLLWQVCSCPPHPPPWMLHSCTLQQNFAVRVCWWWPEIKITQRLTENKIGKRWFFRRVSVRPECHKSLGVR